MLKQIRNKAKASTDQEFATAYPNQMFVLSSIQKEGSFTELCVGGSNR